MRQQIISVIVPVYNVSPYLHRCVNSLLEQTYPNIEIILIDDGSTDGSEKICDEYAQCHPNITVIHQKNSGQAAARNVGLRIATGDWIGFLDSDDWAEKNMYETLITLGQSYGADLASCATRQLTVNGKILSEPNTGEIRILSPDDIIAGLVTREIVRFEVWNKLWKRTLIEEVSFIEGQLCEEVHFDRIAFLRANKMVHIDSVLHNYLVMRPGSTATSFKMARLCIFDEFDSLIQDLEKMKKLDLANMVRGIAATFAYGFFCEAVDTRQSIETKKRLLQYFEHFYEEGKERMLPLNKNDAKMLLFHSCPGLLMCLRRIKKLL